MSVLLKRYCGNCGGGIEFESAHYGQAIKCPHCDADVVLGEIPPKLEVPPVPNLKCPFCYSSGPFMAVRKMNTEGWITMLVGILLAPILIGIVLFFVAQSFKDTKHICQHCGKTF